ncbi:MAG TPA: methyltransferase domain-containing protein [Anaerolineales bacterium]|nr:methyltransferase domain-containing protein [Anaerolineales bacterium]HRQ93021.1 methyltransferase domain-containing protein [Anaerolineales bacterium]
MQTLLRVFFYLLYQPLAWSYDAVAWLVSLGRWRSWVNSALGELPPSGRILELGHGPGHLQVAMRNAGYSPVGIDLSAQMGRLAARRLAASSTLLLVRADGRKLPFRRGAFAGVVATFPTEYVVQASTLGEVRRVLLADGRLVLLPVAWITGGNLLERAAAWLFRITGEAGHWDGRFTQLVRSAGFEAHEQRVTLPGSEVMLVVATPLERD